MIINKKTLAFLTRSDIPNKNWTKQESYIIDDNSELAKKIIKNAPNVEYVIESGKVVDVKITKAEKQEEYEAPIKVESRLEVLENAILESLSDTAETEKVLDFFALQHKLGKIGLDKIPEKHRNAVAEKIGKYEGV